MGLLLASRMPVPMLSWVWLPYERRAITFTDERFGI